MPASPSNNGYEPGFAATLMAKDLGPAANALDQTGVEALIGSRAAEIYRASRTAWTVIGTSPRPWRPSVSAPVRSGRAR